MDFITAELLNSLGTVGICVAIMISLVMGKGLATQRELRQRDETIKWLRETNAELMAQNRELVIGTRVATDAFEKVSQAAVEGSGT